MVYTKSMKFLTPIFPNPYPLLLKLSLLNISGGSSTFKSEILLMASH